MESQVFCSTQYDAMDGYHQKWVRENHCMKEDGDELPDFTLPWWPLKPLF
jgi:hypothetical protein